MLRLTYLHPNMFMEQPLVGHQAATSATPETMHQTRKDMVMKEVRMKAGPPRARVWPLPTKSPVPLGREGEDVVSFCFSSFFSSSFSSSFSSFFSSSFSSSSLLLSLLLLLLFSLSLSHFLIFSPISSFLLFPSLQKKIKPKKINLHRPTQSNHLRMSTLQTSLRRFKSVIVNFGHKNFSIDDSGAATSLLRSIVTLGRTEIG